MKRRKVRKKKKGSLELSANAIVILIIAITIMGLALTLVKNMFSELGGQIGKQSKATAVVEKATAQRPITMPQTIQVERGEEQTLVIGYYNNKDYPLDRAFAILYSCVQGDIEWYNRELGPDTDDYTGKLLFDVSCVRKYVGKGDSTEFEVVIKAGGGIYKGKSTCLLRVEDENNMYDPEVYTEKGFFLEVP